MSETYKDVVATLVHINILFMLLIQQQNKQTYDKTANNSRENLKIASEILKR